jgi:proton-dependent oligopeptide transporter, POT family
VAVPPDPVIRPTDLLGHPRGLLYLCLSEAWERFSYFGMQSLLVLYLTHQLLRPEHVHRVAGFGAFRAVIEGVTGPLSDAALASQIFGLYAGLVYLTPLLGGLVADRWLDRTATVTIGAVTMALGHFLMAFDPTFLLAMALLLAGVGCFKGNIASQVGGLYAADDPRRASAFQVFQLFISTSVIVSPLVCGTLGEKVGWHYGFAAAGIGMLIGLATYLWGRRWLPASATPAIGTARSARQAPRLTRSEWGRVALLVALLPVLAGAMVGNQQMFNTFVVWGERSFDLHVLGRDMPVTWLLSFDALIAVGCLLLTIAFWRAYARRRREPDDIVKIAIGAAIMAAAPLLLTAASLHQAATGAKLSIGWGLGFEVANEVGFAMLVPVALSFYSRVAPRSLQGLAMGMFYLTFFFSNLVVGRLGGMLEQMTAAGFWVTHAAIAAVAALVLGVMAFGRRLVPASASA